jgi:hypothetical protein
MIIPWGNLGKKKFVPGFLQGMRTSIFLEVEVMMQRLLITLAVLATMFMAATQTLSAQADFIQLPEKSPAAAQTASVPNAPDTENPTKYATQEFLVAETSRGLPRNEYYSRDGDHLSAIARFGLKEDGSIEVIGWAENKEAAAALRKIFRKTKFLSPEDKGGKFFSDEFARLMKKRGGLRDHPQ